MQKQKIIVGFSGGVDSLATSILLKEQGHEVLAITLLLHDLDDISVHKIADKYNIAHKYIDLRQDFKKFVIDKFIYEYEKGNTPNPCIYCNKHIKYGKLLNLVEEYNFDKLALGHYARMVFDEESNRYRLFRIAQRKDQTYNLFQLSQAQMSKIIFPISIFESKEKVRNFLRDRQIDIFGKKDSVGLCFCGTPPFTYLKNINSSAAKTGIVKDSTGKLFGTHQGISHYTIGQKKNLPARAKGMAVLAINSQNNTIIIGKEEELYYSEIVLDEINIINSFSNDEKLEIRLSQWSEVYYAYASVENDKINIVFENYARAPAIGQYGVLYRGDELLAGGRIAIKKAQWAGA